MCKLLSHDITLNHTCPFMGYKELCWSQKQYALANHRATLCPTILHGEGHCWLGTWNFGESSSYSCFSTSNSWYGPPMQFLNGPYIKMPFNHDYWFLQGVHSHNTKIPHMFQLLNIYSAVPIIYSVHNLSSMIGDNNMTPPRDDDFAANRHTMPPQKKIFTQNYVNAKID